MSAFTQHLNPIQSIAVFEGLTDSYGVRSQRLTDGEKKDLVAGIYQSRFMDPTWYAKMDPVQFQAYSDFLDKFSPDVPLPAASLAEALMAVRFPTSSAVTGVSSFEFSAKKHISDALSKSRSLFGPAFESRLTTQLQIHSKLCDLAFLGVSFGPKRFVKLDLVMLDHLPRLLELFGPENQDVKSIVVALKTEMKLPIRTAIDVELVQRARDMLAALNL
jgi:hypothetical protein